MKKWGKILIGIAVIAALGAWIWSLAPPRATFPEDAEVFLHSDFRSDEYGDAPRQISQEDAEIVVSLFNSYPYWDWWTDPDCILYRSVTIGEEGDTIYMCGGNYCMYAYLDENGQTKKIELHLNDEDEAIMDNLFHRYLGERA